jgi:hypothetical protein
LFEAVEGFVEAANMCGVCGINKPGGLLTVDRLSKIAMEECIFDVHLMNRPRVCGGNAEDDANGSRFDNRAKCLTIIQSRLLCKSTNNPSSFVSCQGAIGMKFVPIDPFSCYQVNTCRSRHKRTSIIPNKSIKFIKHCVVPMGVF